MISVKEAGRVVCCFWVYYFSNPYINLSIVPKYILLFLACFGACWLYEMILDGFEYLREKKY